MLMCSAIKLIVGLGNPGTSYAETRHNIGFWWIDQLAQYGNARLQHDKKFHGLITRVCLHGHELYLLQPQCFMNKSGLSVSAVARFYKFLPRQILVAHDELDLPAGDVRLKYNGGHGGHNGLRDLQTQLSSSDFWRLRVGIGHPGDRALVKSFVLTPPSREEKRAVLTALDKAMRVLLPLVKGDMQAAMLQLHTRSSA